MANQLNQLPSSQEPIGTFSDKNVPVRVSDPWYQFFRTISSLFASGGTGGGGAGASAILDTLGSQIGGMLSRFGSGWAEFVATVPNSIPVMNPGGTPVSLRTISQLLDGIGAVHGDILYRDVVGWQVLSPVVGGYLQSQGPGADPQYVGGTNSFSVDTGLTATGVDQATALALANNWNEVTTVAAGTGVRVAALGIGQPSKVWNIGANALLVYPPAGGAIDALAVNAAYSLPVNRCQEFDQLTANRWRSTQLG